MIRATVIGSVWSSRHIDGLPPGAFLEVQPEAGTPIIAFDVLGSGTGEQVLVAQGSVAASWFPGAPPPVDALVIGAIDPASPSTLPGRPKSAAKKAVTNTPARRAGTHPQEKK